MRLTDEQQTSVDDALYPKMQPVTDYSADPGLGVYSPSTTQPVQDYSLGFGGSPVTSYSTPDANNDGLNDTTGWAMGVQQDQSSPTGFSYNGQPTQSNGALYTAPQYGPSVQQDNAYQQAQNQYLGDSPNSGVYQDPGGNVWENGNWWNQNGEVWNDQAQSWLSPAQYNDFAQQSQDYGNAQANPQFQPTTYQQPGGDWFNYDNQAPQNYNLVGQGLDQIATTNPQPDWMGRFGGAYGGTSTLDKLGTLGGDALTALQAPKEYVGKPAFGILSGLTEANRQPIYDSQGNITGYTRDPSLTDALTQIPKAIGKTIVDPVGQYQAGRTATNEYFANPENSGVWNAVGQTAIDPLSFAGPGIAAKVIPDAVPAAGLLRGLIDQGGGAAVLGGSVGGTVAASDAAKNIPVFGDQPAWLRGLEGTVIGGVGAAGAAGTLKNTAESGASNGFRALGNEVGQAATPGPNESLNPIRRKIADALDAEAKFRNSGEAEAIKSVKRGEQAAGLNAVQAGATSADTLANVSAGAKVGKFFDNTPGIKLPEADYNAALTDIVNSTDGFDKIQAVKALQKLQNGERLQPGEIKTLGKLYGPEVEAKIRMTNANRIQTVADLTPEDTARIARQAEVDGKRIATLEVTAQRQHQLADNLQKRSFMDPTNKSLKMAAENARARAISQENQANSLLADQARKLETKQNQKAFTAAQKAAQKDSTNALRSDLSAEFKASGQAKMAEAEKLIDDANVSPVLKTQLKQTLAVQLKTNGAVLDGMGKDGPGVIRKIYAATTGQVTDSWTSKLLSQEALLRNSLEVQGLDEKTARQVARLLQDAEIKMRFGDATPKYVQDSLDQARGIQRDAMGKIIKGENGPQASLGVQTAEDVAHLSQLMKNTTMGIGDVAVVGVNGPKAILTDAPTLIAGTINRLLNKAHLGIDTGFATNNLPRAAQKALDGISGSTIGVTDLSKDGTIISLIPKIGPTLDKGPVKIAAGLMDLQYKKIMGSLRDVAHEGNLVLAHVAGLDVNDPLVRQQAAKWANVGTLSADLAQRKGRAAAERAGMMSPTMRRAQIQQGGLIARGLAALGSDATYIATFGKVAKQMDSAARLDELKAITTIASTAMVTLAVGKYLNDWIGLEPFQFDPSKPGFGNMTVPDGAGGTMVVNLFPQEQIAKATARSLRLIAEGKVTDADWTAVLKEWGKVGITSSSPPVSMFEKGILNTGFDPQAGQYKFGDFNQGLKKNLVGAFLPPIAQSVINEGFGPISTPLQGAGFNVYPESQYQTRDRWIKQNQGLFTGDLVQPGKTPDKYANLSPTGKQLADAQAGKAAPFGQEGKDAAGVVQRMTVLQGEDDTKRQMGQLTPEDWRRNYTARKEELFIRNDQIYAKLRESGKLTSKNPDPILDPYYKAIEASKAGNGGQPNWDQVDAYRATLSTDANNYIDANTGMVKISTPETQKFQQDYNSIKNSGYFDKADQSWKQVSSLVPTWDKLGSPVNPSDYQSYDAWRQAALQAGLKLAGKTTEDIATVTEINSWLDKQDPAKGQAYYTGQWSDQWVANNPKAAYEAWKYGYFNPKKEIKAWLAGKFE